MAGLILIPIKDSLQGAYMDAKQPITLLQISQRIEATDADLSGSTFTDVKLANAVFRDVNLAGATIADANLARIRISEADLRDASITDSVIQGMTIDGVAVSDLFAAYRDAQLKKS